MDNVLCPHCGQVVQRDPALAGRAIACPACRGQFTMPASALLPPPVPQPPPLPLPPPVPLPPPGIGTSQPDSLPVIVTAPPKQPQAATKRAPADNKTLLIAGIAAAVALLIGIGAVVVALNWPRGAADNVAASASSGGSDEFDPSRPLPPLDQLIGRPFSADHPDAEARIAEAQQRKISIMQGGGEVQLGDVTVSDNSVSDYGGFTFGINARDGKPVLTTSTGDEPLRIPRSFGADRSIVERFLKQHHGAANVRIEQFTDEPYYLAHLAAGGREIAGQFADGRSRQEIEEHFVVINELQEEKTTISRLERIGTVVRAVYRLQGRTSSAIRADEEFLVLNGKVVCRFGSSREVSVGD